jgi:glycosyltransferase involved in cell wall biosynthesis
MPQVAVLVPCFNEAGAAADTLRTLAGALTDAGLDFQIIAINDGSTDATPGILDAAAGGVPRIRVIHHEGNRGYGAALRGGIAASSAPLIAIVDADGTYPLLQLPAMIERCRDEGLDMLIAARVGAQVSDQGRRRVGKWLLRGWVSYLTGRRVPDVNSGMRVFRRDAVEPLLKWTPAGYSFTTTITVGMLCGGKKVAWEAIDYAPRIGRSKFRLVTDTAAFFRLAVRVGWLFARVRLAAALLALGLIGLGLAAAGVAIATAVTN